MVLGVPIFKHFRVYLTIQKLILSKVYYTETPNTVEKIM